MRAAAVALIAVLVLLVALAWWQASGPHIYGGVPAWMPSGR